jgi:hypothetical protein
MAFGSGDWKSSQKLALKNIQAFEKENVSILKDASMAKITDALESFAQRVGPTDNFLILYSGQSFWDSSSEAGFWLPANSQGIGFWFLPSDEKECTKLAWLSNKMNLDQERALN